MYSASTKLLNKRNASTLAILPLLLCSFFLSGHSAFAAAPFSNSTLNTQKHPRPIAISEQDIASTTIALEGSSTLHIYRNTVHGTPLWRFEIDNAYWWVSSKGIISGRGTNATSGVPSAFEAGNDEEAYLVYLSMK